MDYFGDTAWHASRKVKQPMWQESSEGVQNEPSQNVWLIDGWIILGTQLGMRQEK